MNSIHFVFSSSKVRGLKDFGPPGAEDAVNNTAATFRALVLAVGLFNTIALFILKFV